LKVGVIISPWQDTVLEKEEPVCVVDELLQVLVRDGQGLPKIGVLLQHFTVIWLWDKLRVICARGGSGKGRRGQEQERFSNILVCQ